MPSFSTTLEQAIHGALALANARRHELATLEHLLLSLIDEPDAARVMKACSVDLTELRKTLIEFIDDDLSTLVTDVEGSEAVPTAAFQLFSWWLPVGFLPLRRPRWVWATAVGGAPLLLSSWGGVAEPWWHHGAVMVPFAIGGALAAMAVTAVATRQRQDAGLVGDDFGDGRVPRVGRRIPDTVRAGVGVVVALGLIGRGGRRRWRR